MTTTAQAGPALADLLRSRAEAGGASTEETLASLLPLFRQVAEVHAAGRVAPLRGIGRLHVDGVRVWFEASLATEPLLAVARLREVERPESRAFRLVEKASAATDVTGGGRAVVTRRIGKPGAAIEAPVYLPDHVAWEHEVGHHDPLTDIFSLGMLLASLSLGLDLGDPDDLESFVLERGNLFRLKEDLHPVLAKTIVRMTELERHDRAQDLPGIVQALEGYRDQAIDFAIDLARIRGFGTKAPSDRRQVLLGKLRERLFEISRRNRLLYHRPTLQTLNLTLASVPILLDVRGIRPDQILTWHSGFAKRSIAGEAIPLGQYLRFEEAPYISGVLDGIIAEAKRDQAEVGFSQLRLAVCFLRWHNLKEEKEERIETPLVLLPVRLTRKKGVRDAYVLEAPSPIAEINPALRYHFRQLYGVEMPETIDLSAASLDAFHEALAKQIHASEPAVTLRKIDRPEIELVHEKARRRLDQYQRRLALRGRGTRSFADLTYSYDRDNFLPLGLRLFQARVRPANAALGDLLAARPRRHGGFDAERPPDGAAAPTEVSEDRAAPGAGSGGVSEREQLFYRVRPGGESNPYGWDFDLTSVTLGNFKYRKMSLVRDYDALIEEEVPDRAFDAIFSPEPRPAETPATAIPPIEERFPVVPCDPTQAEAIARAAGGGSYVIQGPPGTGKSQTITNLIADHVARGKRVLFVCEKRAAIDVVYHRLEQSGLHELCCLIHDSQADKKPFILDLKATYERFLAEAALPEAEWERKRGEVLNAIRAELEPLERFDRTMRSAPEEAGLPLSRLLHRRFELPEAALDGGEWPPYAAWAGNTEPIRRLRAALDEVREDGVLARHPLSRVAGAVLREPRPMEWLGARLEEASRKLRSVREALRDAGAPGDECDTLARARRFAAVAGQARFLADLDLVEILDPSSAGSRLYEEAVSEYGARTSALAVAREAAKGWRRKLPRAEVRTALVEARALSGLLAFLKPAWWRLRRVLNECYDFRSHAVRPGWTQVLEALDREHEAGEAEAKTGEALRGRFRSPEPFARFVERVEAARAAAASADPPVAAFFRPAGAGAVRRLADLAPVLASLETDLPAVLVAPADAAIAVLEEDLARIRGALDLTAAFLPCLAELERLPPELSGAFRDRPLTADELEAASADRTLRGICLDDIALSRFTGAVREGHLERLERLHREWQESSAKCVRERVARRFRERILLSSRPADLLTPPEREVKKRTAQGRKELEHEFGKTMRYRSIRDLMSDPDAGPVIRDLKPVWLMSPLSVSDTLPLDPGLFDVVIFDEASQIPLEGGVPSLFRSHQAIVVGDRMQLPPTSFFTARRTEEDLVLDDDAPPADLEADSFLAHADGSLPSSMLGWHYRSRSEALISFSNSRFYDRRLWTVPEPRPSGEAKPEIRVADRKEGERNAVEVLGRSISFHSIEKGLYQQRRNVPEADYIARLVKGLLESGSRPTIGIVAFSEAQQAAIESALERLAEEDRDFKNRLEREIDREEDGQFAGLLVKNLENIQGDERDAVILSVCYGPDADGRMAMNFGPINQGGGEKRLNVAFSRAKRHMAVVSSIGHGRITNVYNDGANCLRNYLRYAEAVSIGDLPAAERVLAEVEARREERREEARADAVVEQVAGALASRGLEADLRVGHSGLKCDLAVRRPGDREYAAAILLDAPETYDQADVLARDILRPAVLKAFGWRVFHILSKDWYLDRKAVLERFERFLA